MALLQSVLFAFGAYALVRASSPVPVARALRIGIAATAAISGISLLRVAVSHVRHIGEWDFLCFWLYGKAAVAHANVYAPATYHAMALPIATTPEFRPEILDVGFPYPPPTIALFAPLGLANIHLASALWMPLLLAALIAAIAIASRPYGPTVTYAVATLAFSLPATTETVGLQQTSFLALLAIAIASAAAVRNGLVAGIAAGAATIVKPYLAVVPLWLALRRRWWAAIASVATVAIVTIAAIPLLGPGGGSAYLHQNPAARMPASVFAEHNDSSLYAGLLRLTRASGSMNGPMHDPVFLAIVATLALVTVGVAVLAADPDADLALGSLVAFGLIAYPGTSEAYAIVLLPAAIALARRLDASLAPGAAALGLAFYLASAVGGDAMLVGYCATWLALVGALLARSGKAARFGAMRVPT